MTDNTGKHEAAREPVLSNTLYDQLKFVAQILLPAVGTLYFSLAGIWNLPDPEQVVGTIVVFDTFLGVLLGFTTTSYQKNDSRFDGVINVVPNLEKGLTDVSISMDPRAVANKGEVVMKVNSPS